MMNMKLPPTVKKVRMNTKEEVNDMIEKQTKENIAFYRARSTSEIIDRIDELDKEWDIERVMETNAAIIILAGSLATIATNKKRWAVLSGITSGFLLEHALEGWCPPVPLLRRMGVRTSEEINMEKNALKNVIF